jgi:hypothetical protein
LIIKHHQAVPDGATRQQNKATRVVALSYPERAQSIAAAQ